MALILRRRFPHCFLLWRANPLPPAAENHIFPESLTGADTAGEAFLPARRGSSPDWKMLDPQLPKSVWYHTSAPWIGFRVVRPAEVPSAEELYRIWNNGVALDN
jgi:hypothetical protein